MHYSAVIVGPNDCTFNIASEPLCGWTQDVSSDSLNWLRHTGSTPSSGTGPSKDFTGSGTE